MAFLMPDMWAKEPTALKISAMRSRWRTRELRSPGYQVVGPTSEARARFEEGAIAVSSVTFAVKGEGALDHLLKSGLRLRGRYCGVEVFEEITPDALCGVCGGWTILRRSAAEIGGWAHR